MFETLFSLVVANPVVIAIFGGIVGGIAAVVAAFFKGRKSGRRDEQVKQLRKDAKERKRNDILIKSAQRAADNVDTDSMSNDGFRRE